MDLLTLIALLVLIYISWLVYLTFKSMDMQLKDLNRRCVGQPAPAATTSQQQQPGSNLSNKVTETLITGLQKAMLAATPQ